MMRLRPSLGFELSLLSPAVVAANYEDLNQQLIPQPIISTRSSLEICICRVQYSIRA